MINFLPQKNIDLLKLGCTLSNLANIFLYNSTDAKIYPFSEGDTDFQQKTR